MRRPEEGRGSLLAGECGFGFQTGGWMDWGGWEVRGRDGDEVEGRVRKKKVSGDTATDRQGSGSPQR